METKPKHTPEPWDHEDGYIIEKDNGEYGYQIAHVNHPNTDFPSEEIEANAARIVECVNAMAGIGAPIEFMNQIKSIKADDVLNAMKERDELIGLLQNLEGILESNGTITPKSIIRTAIQIAIGKISADKISNI